MKQILKDVRQSAKTAWRFRQAARDVRAHGFWFVDIPRTSSSSIKAELGQAFSASFGKSNLLEKEFSQDSSFKDHMTAQQVQDLLGPAVWEPLFTFTFVRNPWDRLLSLYAYRSKRSTIPAALTFRDYVLQFRQPRYFAADSAHARPTYFYTMADFVLSPQGEIMVDFVGRFENRAEDMQRVAEKLGCSDLGNLHLQKANTSQEHYSQFYDDETRDIVAQIYAKDIELFGYTFEA